ncbi:MAG: hypothetical protein JNM56_18685 [Planctomycetia bacterium]|nr:hypothetical protein [Planctomycetia bacterium]
MDTVAEPVPDVVVMARRTGTRWLSVLQMVARDLNAGTEVVAVFDWPSVAVQVYYENDRPRCFQIDPTGIPAMRQLFA